MSDDETKTKGPKMVDWVKKDGTKVQTNDMAATIAAAESLGWKRKGKKGE